MTGHRLSFRQNTWPVRPFSRYGQHMREDWLHYEKTKRPQELVIILLFLIILAILVPVIGMNTIGAAAMPGISKFPYEIVIGGSSQIKLKGVPKDAKVTYKSSKKNAAAVSKKGKVIGIKSVSTKITVFVRTKSMREKLICKTTVKKPYGKIE